MATQSYDPRYTSGHQAPPGHVTAVVHKQYNSPMPLYSMENIADTLASQAQVLTNGAVGVDFHALGSPVLQRSQVYRMLQEQEGRVERATPSPTPRPDSPPATFQSQSFIRIQKSLGDTEDEPAPPTAAGKLQDIRKPSPLTVEWPPPSQTQQQQQQQQYQSTYTGTSPQYHPSIAAHKQQEQQYRSPGPQYQQQYRPAPTAPQQQYHPQVAAQPLHSPTSQPQQPQFRPVDQPAATGYRPQVAAQPLQSSTPPQQFRPQPQVSAKPLHTAGAPQQSSPQQYRPQVTAQPLSSPVAVSPAFHPTVSAHQSLTKATQGTPVGQANDPGSPSLRQQASAPSSNATGYRGAAPTSPDNNAMGESSPSMRRRPMWPPQDHRQYLQTSTQSMHFTASKASKKFVWPPPKEYTSYEYEEYQQQSPVMSRRDAQRRADGFLPGPTRVVRIQPRSPARLAAEAWQPYSGGQNEHHVRFAPGSAPSRRIKQFEDVIHQSNATRLPPTYRPPPGTQHVVFESEDED